MVAIFMVAVVAHSWCMGFVRAAAAGMPT
jgi:hypothetical protein